MLSITARSVARSRYNSADQYWSLRPARRTIFTSAAAGAAVCSSGLETLAARSLLVVYKNRQPDRDFDPALVPLHEKTPIRYAILLNCCPLCSLKHKSGHTLAMPDIAS